MAGHDTVYITVGKIGASYGVRGWVKVYSYTEQTENLLDYDPWYLAEKRHLSDKSEAKGNSLPNQAVTQKAWRRVKVVEAKEHGKGLVAKFEQCNDRDAAVLLTGLEIAIRRDQLPETEAGEYYWVDLQGLEVQTLDGISLGVVDHLLETGANDVLVVKGERERLIPYVKEHIVKEVDLEAGIIRVDWDPDYE